MFFLTFIPINNDDDDEDDDDVHITAPHQSANFVIDLLVAANWVYHHCSCDQYYLLTVRT